MTAQPRPIVAACQPCWRRARAKSTWRAGRRATLFSSRPGEHDHRFLATRTAGTFAPLGTKVGAAVRNVMFDAVGDAWFVLVDGTTWIGFREGDAWNFDPGGSFHGCDSDGFRELGDYILCDDGHARERFSFVDEPGAPLEHYSPARAATASGDSIIVFGEDGFARLYAADHDSRRSDDCGHWPG